MGGSTLVHVGHKHAGVDGGNAAAAKVGSSGVIDGFEGGVEAGDDVGGVGPVEEALGDDVGTEKEGHDGGFPVGLEVLVGEGRGAVLGDAEEVVWLWSQFLALDIENGMGIYP